MHRNVVIFAVVGASICLLPSCDGDGSGSGGTGGGDTAGGGDETPPPTVFAHRIVDAADLVGGTDALGGIGDWYLANDVVELIIDDVQNQNNIAPSGGTVIDYALKGMDNDQFNSMYQIFLIDQSLPIVYDTIEGTVEDDRARITVTGHVFSAGPTAPLNASLAEQLTVVTDYELRSGDTSLYVRTVLTNESSEVVASSFGGTPLTDVVLRGSRSALAFAPYPNRGFNHPPLNVAAPIGAFGAFAYVAMVSDVEPAVSYGMMAPSLGTEYAGVNDYQITALGMKPVGDSLQPGAQVTFERRLLIGAEGTVESVASQAFRVQAEENPDLVPGGIGTLRGRVTGLQAGRTAQVIAVTPAFLGPKPTNATTAKGTGEFVLTLPEAEYTLEITVGSLPKVVTSPISVAGGEEANAGDIAAPPMGTVSFTITSDGAAKPARLTLKGDSGAGTNDPVLGPPFSTPVSGNVAHTRDGTGSLSVEPGTYDVYASRGLEYTVAHRQVTVAPGGTETLNFALTKVVDTAGRVSVDAHVHSGASFDSSVEIEDRVLTFAAEGVEVVISTEHDYIADYQPAVDALDLGDQMGVITGVEATGFVPTPALPRTIGHNNAWPMSPDSTMARAGAPRDERIEPGELYERLRAIATSAIPVVQLNHGRASAVGTIGLGYFTNFDFDPTLPIPGADDGGTNSFLRREGPGGTQNHEFDAMEILNGASWSSVYTNIQNRDDWFALLKQGFVKTAMGNSDSHQVAIEAAGFARNYVAYAADTPVDLDIDTLDEAILAGRSVATTGPIIVATIDGAALGDTLDATALASATLSLHVEAAPWIPVEEIRIWVNGALACTIDQATTSFSAPVTACPAGLAADPADPFGTAGVGRYDGDITIDVLADMFVVVEAGGALPVGEDRDGDGVLDTWDTNGDGDASDETAGALPPFDAPPIPDALVPGMLPWAITNPIFIDTDGGGWSPPGL